MAIGESFAGRGEIIVVFELIGFSFIVADRISDVGTKGDIIDEVDFAGVDTTNTTSRVGVIESYLGITVFDGGNVGSVTRTSDTAEIARRTANLAFGIAV